MEIALGQQYNIGEKPTVNRMPSRPPRETRCESLAIGFEPLETGPKYRSLRNDMPRNIKIQDLDEGISHMRSVAAWYVI